MIVQEIIDMCDIKPNLPKEISIMSEATMTRSQRIINDKQHDHKKPSVERLTLPTKPKHRTTYQTSYAGKPGFKNTQNSKLLGVIKSTVPKEQPKTTSNNKNLQNVPFRLCDYR